MLIRPIGHSTTLPDISKKIRNTFKKQERLCSKKQMDLLFEKGKSFTNYPVKAVFLETPVDLQFSAQVMFVVAKKNFKKSPDRNILKRRMRETYRLNKNEFYYSLQSEKKKMLVAFIYISKKEEDYSVIENSIKKILIGILKK